MENTNKNPEIWYINSIERVFKDCDCACETHYKPDIKNKSDALLSKIKLDYIKIADNHLAV